MKKVKILLLLAFALVLFTSCSDDCTYVKDHALISSLSAEINALNVKITNSTNEAEKTALRSQVATKTAQLDIAVVGECK